MCARCICGMRGPHAWRKIGGETAAEQTKRATAESVSLTLASHRERAAEKVSLRATDNRRPRSRTPAQVPSVSVAAQMLPPEWPRRRSVLAAVPRWPSSVPPRAATAQALAPSRGPRAAPLPPCRPVHTWRLRPQQTQHASRSTRHAPPLTQRPPRPRTREVHAALRCTSF
jgi:hypothetical protein